MHNILDKFEFQPDWTEELKMPLNVPWIYNGSYSLHRLIITVSNRYPGKEVVTGV